MHPRLLPIALFLAGGVWGGCSKDQPSDQRSPAHSAAARTVQPRSDAGAAKSTSDGAQSALPETVASHPPSAPSTPNAVNLPPPRDTGGGLARNTPYAALFEAGRTWRYRTTFEETAYYSLPGSGDISSKRHTRRVDVLECSVPRVIHFPQAVVSEVTCTELEQGETSVTQNPPAKPGEELTAPLMFSRPPQIGRAHV